ncbi:interleukin-1 receptor type 2 [Rhinatrema bivittatum]|uniref:interleukin-1 receptor type 2 n=1 Tax=Rhinatrema bivittatum TaxID=194408 RepID=UPI00112E431F|nr:interleukin-1 receptor type 2 [Rhinatrema bivittatum]XP_029460676.1 interleukin-1 receptor type 2 [Rhinatrema bivittatum]
MRTLCFLFAAVSIYLQDTAAFRVHRLNKTEKCQESFVHFKNYCVQQGEPTVLKCPIFRYQHLKLNKGSNLSLHLTWYKNDSKIPIPEVESRMQAREDSLWFVPAAMDDSGHYVCVLRNSSFCIEVTISLTVVKSNNAALRDIAYPHNAFTLTNDQLVCPDLSDFVTKDTDLDLRWYKESVLLPKLNNKFKYVVGTNKLIINDVTAADEGLYTCELPFTHRGTRYNITRVIQLQTVDQEKRNHPVIVYPDHKTIAAVLGSKLIIPCKVFTGLGKKSGTVVWWLANNSFVNRNPKYDGRVTEGTFLKTTKNDGNYIEVQLTFEEIREEDFSTSFNCIAKNDYGLQVLPTRIGKAAPAFSWYMAAVPAALACLIVGVMVMYKFRKPRTQKDYILAKS